MPQRLARQVTTILFPHSMPLLLKMEVEYSVDSNDQLSTCSEAYIARKGGKFVQEECEDG